MSYRMKQLQTSLPAGWVPEIDSVVWVDLGHVAYAHVVTVSPEARIARVKYQYGKRIYARNLSFDSMRPSKPVEFRRFLGEKVRA